MNQCSICGNLYHEYHRNKTTFEKIPFICCDISKPRLKFSSKKISFCFLELIDIASLNLSFFILLNL